MIKKNICHGIQIFMVGVILMTVSIDLTGCIDNRQEYEEQACQLLEEKYRESFEIVEYYGRDRIEDTYALLAVSQSYPDLLFDATVACDGSYIIDQYVTARVCNQIEEQMTENLSIMPGYTLIKARAVSKTIDSTDADMTIEEFMAIKTKNKFTITLHYCPEDEMVDVRSELEKAFRGLECLSGYLDIYIVDEALLRQVQTYLGENARMDYGYEKLLESVEKTRLSFNRGRIE